MVIFLALVLKLPLIGIFAALWVAFQAKFDEDRPAVGPSGRPDGPVRLLRHAHHRSATTRTCCTSGRTAIGAARARRCSTSSRGSCASRSRSPTTTPSEPRYCPGCGDEAVWTPIEPIDLGTARPRHVETG